MLRRNNLLITLAVPYNANLVINAIQMSKSKYRAEQDCPKGVIIPDRADCKGFQGKQIRSTKTGKLNRYQYMYFFPLK